MLKKIIILIGVLIPAALNGQKVAQKTNMLYWATTTPNLGVEVALGQRLSLEVTAGYNPWEFKDDMSLRHWLVHGSLRYWFCRPFEKHFLAADGLYAKYDIGHIPFISKLEDRAYKGDLYGGGISYGYHLPLGRRWGVEFTVGVGYLRFQYDEYTCDGCTEILKRHTRDYFGPTRAGVTFIFMLR